MPDGLLLFWYLHTEWSGDFTQNGVRKKLAERMTRMIQVKRS